MKIAVGRSKSLLHEVGLFVSSVTEQGFINTSVCIARLLSLIEHSGLKQLLFSEKALCLSVTSLSRSSMKQTDMSAILGTGGRSPLILQTSGLLGNMSMVRWLEHVFLFSSCEACTKDKLQVGQACSYYCFCCCLLLVSLSNVVFEMMP